MVYYQFVDNYSAIKVVLLGVKIEDKVTVKFVKYHEYVEKWK
jgi:hypothetical protein